MDKNYLKTIYDEIIMASQIPDSTDAYFDFKQQNIPENSDTIYVLQFGRVGETVWGIKAIEKLSEIFSNKKIIFVVEKCREDLFRQKYSFEVEYWDFRCFEKMVNELSTNSQALLVNLGRNNISRISTRYLKDLTDCTVIGAAQLKNRINIYGNDYTIIGQLKSSQRINYIHEAELLLRKVGVNEEFSFQKKETKRYRGGTIAIATGASNPIRKWGIDKFVQLMKLINKKFPAKYVILGKKEENEEFRKCSPDLVDIECEYTDKKSLKEQIDLLKFCDFLICNDSGWMHIAESIDIMTICISGPTNPYITGCYFSEGVSICANIKCRPCYEITCDSLRCETLLSVESVYKIVIAWMKGTVPLIGSDIQVVYRKDGQWDDWCFDDTYAQRTAAYILKKITIQTMCNNGDHFVSNVNSRLVKEELCQIANNIQNVKDSIEDFIKFDLLSDDMAGKSILVEQLYEWVECRPYYLFALFEFLLVKNGFWSIEPKFNFEKFLKQFLDKVDGIYKTLRRIVDDR